MSVCYADGLILNIATLLAHRPGAAHAFATVARSALAAMTRSQAQEWAGRGIRFNAIAPSVHLPFHASPCGEPDIAALALHLASARGKELSGHIFEAEEA
jgi:3-oxoacyl-[acyl-carrier protein] reductase